MNIVAPEPTARLAELLKQITPPAIDRFFSPTRVLKPPSNSAEPLVMSWVDSALVVSKKQIAEALALFSESLAEVLKKA